MENIRFNYKIKYLAEGNILNVGKALAPFANLIPAQITRGRAKQVKAPKMVTFKSLEAAMNEPEFLIWDFAKFDQPPQLHSLWQALYRFEKKVY